MILPLSPHLVGDAVMERVPLYLLCEDDVSVDVDAAVLQQYHESQEV